MILDPPTGPAVPVAGLGRVHLVGVGGAGMSGIARILVARGAAVSGCDAKDSAALAGLRAVGARVDVGHSAEHVDDVDTLVVSSAVRPDNPDLVAARARGRRILPRAAALASVMLGRRTAAVAGTHGKTTTTSMLTVALQHCGLDPSFAIGGHLNESGSNAHDGTGDIFVAEADESDASFLFYRPAVAVVTNVEADHLDNYGDAESYVAAFDDFVDRLEPGGHLVACADDAGSRALADRSGSRGVQVWTYGTDADADLRVTAVEVTRGTDGGASFEPVLHGRRLGPVMLAMPGEHNVRNAAAALAAGTLLGAPVGALREGIAAFSGTRRRFEPKGSAGGVRVYDDYAHHPTEVAAVIGAARGVARGGRVVVVFQPHLYSRTRIFAADFGAALGLADAVLVMDVYAAREDPQPGVSGAAVAAAVPLPADRVVFEASWSAAPARAVSLVRPGDLLLTVGAGDVTLVGPEVLDLLAAGRSAADDEPGEGT